MAPHPKRKKQIEQRYVEEARWASSIFPNGKLVPHEKPDFLLHTDAGATIGIEVTELCREEARAIAGRLTKIPSRAREQYSKLANAKPVDVSIAFWREEDVSVNDLTGSLVKFVHSHQNDTETGFQRDLPKGFCYIGVFEPRQTAEGNWHSLRGFEVTATPKELIDSCIAEKTQRVPIYKLAAPEAWLLIINDHFLGPGEVRTNLDELAGWTFNSDFDKVLLFLRDAAGRGDVIELGRT